MAARDRIASGIRKFFAALLGLLAALVLWFIFGVVSSFFLGPIQGRNEFGVPVYEDLTANNLITGIAYLLTATVITLALRRRTSTALVAGFAIGAAILGCCILVGM